MRFPRFAKGFSIIEVLVSLLIVGVALTALAPSLGVAVLGRLQSQRVEVATQLAQAEIDRFRNLADQGSFPLNTPSPTPSGSPTPTPSPSATPVSANLTIGFRGYNLPAASLPVNGVPPTPIADTANFTQADLGVGAPGFNDDGTPITGGIVNDPTVKCWPWLDAANASCTPFSNREYVVQIFRDTGDPCCRNGSASCLGSTTTLRNRQIDDIDGIPGNGNDLIRPCGYHLGVRVYHRSAFNDDGTPRGGLNNSREPVAILTTGTNLAGAKQLQPLVVISSEIGAASNLRQYCSFLDPASSCPAPGNLVTPTPVGT